MAVTVHRTGPVDVAGPVVVTERVYWDETKTRLLAEGHPDARFLAHAGGPELSPAFVRAGGLAAVERVTVTEQVPVEPAPDTGEATTEKSTRRTRTRAREDRQLAPGVVADTSIDGQANVLVPEPGSPLRNGVDK